MTSVTCINTGNHNYISILEPIVETALFDNNRQKDLVHSTLYKCRR